nr:MAG TPA: hypothetical protein [Caudoviricetes sp.]
MTLQQELLNYYKGNTEDFNNDIEELDNWSGYLGDGKVFPMEEIDDFYPKADPLEILRRAFFGYDEPYEKCKQHYPFNPNRYYFYLNGYGNLVSTDERDYSDYLDDDFIQEIIDNEADLSLSSGAREIIDNYETEDDE